MPSETRIRLQGCKKAKIDTSSGHFYACSNGPPNVSPIRTDRRKGASKNGVKKAGVSPPDQSKSRDKAWRDLVQEQSAATENKK